MLRLRPARFGEREGGTVTPPTAPFTVDEESSGIIEVTSLLRKDDEDGADDDDHGERNRWMKKGYRYYLGAVQAHYPNSDPELVEGGQLFLMGVPNQRR